MATREEILKKWLPPLTPSHTRYTQLHELLQEAKDTGSEIPLSRAVIQMLAEPAFAQWLHSIGIDSNISSTDQCWAICSKYLYRILYSRDYQGAALLLWGPEVYDPRPRFSRLILTGLHTHTLVNVMGCGSSSKTYSGIAYMLLDWLLDPEWTKVLLVGPTLTHLQQNAFGDLCRLHDQSVIPLPGRADSRTLCINKLVGFGFHTIALAAGDADSAKLKGHKVKARSHRHPLFGYDSRVRILIDEAQNVPTNVWNQLLNVFSNKGSDLVGAGSVERLKIFAAANPSDEYSRYGKNCVPVGGWSKITTTQEEWTSETGWHVIRLNAMLSENVQSRYPIFPRLQTFEGVQGIIRGAGGDDNAPIVYTQVYGMFPPQGSMDTIIKKDHVNKSFGEWIFKSNYVRYLSNDPAYTGDRPATATARVGYAEAWRDQAGEIHKLARGIMAIQLDSTGQLARGDTQDMADEIFSLVRGMQVVPECFSIDRTGAGQGLHDIVRRQWKNKVNGSQDGEPVDILGVHYGEAPSTQKIQEEDTLTPDLMYDTVAAEMWYATAKLFELGVIRIGKGVSMEAVQELLGRRGGRSSTKARKMIVESKGDYKARGNSSPDFADSINLVIHGIRLRESLSAKAPETLDEPQHFGDEKVQIQVGGFSLQLPDGDKFARMSKADTLFEETSWDPESLLDQRD